MVDRPLGPPLSPSFAPPVGRSAEHADMGSSDRIAALVEAHYDFVWRTFRHVGFDDATAEDGAQQVMCVLARRIDDVLPGVERRFLFSTTMRVASTLRRTARRRPEIPDDGLDALAAMAPTCEELLDARRAREVLQQVLDAIPVDLRIVFVLCEIEEMTTPEIAATIGVPLGTASSRLRRAREAFAAIVERMHAAQKARGNDR
jgi:RNA polymerase sigma-70 factor (ECF subfamily)